MRKITYQSFQSVADELFGNNNIAEIYGKMEEAN